MRFGGIILALLVALSAFGADEPAGVPLLPCGNASGASCNPSREEWKRAREAFARGLKLQKQGRNPEAYEQFDKASKLVPRDVDFLTVREMARQQLVFEHLQQGNSNLLKDRQVEALAEFRAALDLDPENEFAQQRLRDALGEWAPKPKALPIAEEDGGELRVVPDDSKHDFRYRGDSRGLLTQVAAAYGVSAMIDDSVVARPTRFFIDNVDFFTAMRAACAVTRTFWAPLGSKQVLLATESPDNHRQFDRMALRSFYVSSASTPAELNDVMNLFRTLFDVRFVSAQPQLKTIVVRAPQPVLDAASRVMENLRDTRPQLLLDFHVYEVSRTLTRQLGLQIPNQFTLFNIPVGALAALGGQNIQDLINQLISSGGINQASSQAISALLAQLGGQQNSIFSQPLATFGGGLTLMGLSLGTAGVQASLNQSMTKTLEQATLRVAHGNDTTFKLGSRFPILNASFAPLLNSPALSGVIQNNSFQAAFPSFNYEDIGLTIKAKPLVDGNQNVTLDLEMQLRSLEAASVNGVPVIANREYKGSIALLNGEPAVVAGQVSHTEQRSLSGIPGLAQVPGLNQIMAQNSKEDDEDELLVVITPHLLTPSSTQLEPEVWLSR